VSRLALVIVLALAGTLLAADPASAHGAGGASPTNYRSVVDSFDATAGVSVRLFDVGDRLELRNDSNIEVVVLGYEDEPYLRVGPDGTFVNTVSPAYYLNQRSIPTGPAPEVADAHKDPEWQKQSDAHIVVWHDHRVHWVSTTPPPQVRADPDHVHVVIPRWTVEMRQGDKTLALNGHLTWVPAPSPLPWYALIVVGAVAAFASLFLPVGRRPVLWVLFGVLLVADVLHTLGAAAETGGTLASRLGSIVQLVTPSAIAWCVGAYGMWRLRNVEASLDGRDGEDAVWFLLFSAAIVAFLGGYSDLSALNHSQIPMGLPFPAARSAVALCAGLGTGMVVVALVLLRRQRRHAADLPENEN
jgi:hypothetical protein